MRSTIDDDLNFVVAVRLLSLLLVYRIEFVADNDSNKLEVMNE